MVKWTFSPLNPQYANIKDGKCKDHHKMHYFMVHQHKNTRRLSRTHLNRNCCKLCLVCIYKGILYESNWECICGTIVNSTIRSQNWRGRCLQWFVSCTYIQLNVWVQPAKLALCTGGAKLQQNCWSCGRHSVSQLKKLVALTSHRQDIGK